MPDPTEQQVPRKRLIASRILAILLVLLAAALVVFGVRLVLDRTRGSRTVATDATLADECPKVAAAVAGKATRTTVHASDGVVLGAAVTGPASARVGVVLRQGASQTICDWLPWATSVAEQTGARVLLFDRRGRGSSPAVENVAKEPGDTAAAVAWLRSGGSSQVALVAASMGNAVVYAALPALTPPPCAVVSISPVLSAQDGRGKADGTALKALVAGTWLAWENNNRDMVRNIDEIRNHLAAQGLPKPHELPVPTKEHSIRLLENHPEVGRFVVDAIRSCGTGG